MKRRVNLNNVGGTGDGDRWAGQGATDEVLDEVGDPQGVLEGAWWSGKFAGSRLLRYLDPYGDAMFNQAQAGDLKIDVRELGGPSILRR